MNDPGAQDRRDQESAEAVGRDLAVEAIVAWLRRRADFFAAKASAPRLTVSWDQESVEAVGRDLAVEAIVAWAAKLTADALRSAADRTERGEWREGVDIFRGGPPG